MWVSVGGAPQAEGAENYLRLWELTRGTGESRWEEGPLDQHTCMKRSSQVLEADNWRWGEGVSEGCCGFQTPQNPGYTRVWECATVLQRNRTRVHMDPDMRYITYPYRVGQKWAYGCLMEK